MLKKFFVCFLFFSLFFPVVLFAESCVNGEDSCVIEMKCHEEFSVMEKKFRRLMSSEDFIHGFLDNVTSWLKSEAENGCDFAKDYYEAILVMKQINDMKKEMSSDRFIPYLFSLFEYLHSNVAKEGLMLFDSFIEEGIWSDKYVDTKMFLHEDASKGESYIDALLEKAGVDAPLSFVQYFLLSVFVNYAYCLVDDMKNYCFMVDGVCNDLNENIPVKFSVQAILAFKLSLDHDIYFRYKRGKLPDYVFLPRHIEAPNKIREYAYWLGKNVLDASRYLAKKAISATLYLGAKAKDGVYYVDEKAREKIHYYDKFRSQNIYAQFAEVGFLVAATAMVYKHFPTNNAVVPDDVLFGRDGDLPQDLPLDPGEVGDADRAAGIDGIDCGEKTKVLLSPPPTQLDLDRKEVKGLLKEINTLNRLFRKEKSVECGVERCRNLVARAERILQELNYIVPGYTEDKINKIIEVAKKNTEEEGD